MFSWPGISVGGAPHGRKARARSYVGVQKFGMKSEDNMRRREGLGPSDPTTVVALGTVAPLAHLVINYVFNVGE
jgi:hypothetical protein